MGRRLVLMGSGETTPGMLGVHREVFADLPADARLAVIDSPFAFQENADELVERISRYFAESLGRSVQRITLPAGADALVAEQALAGIRAADWVFAGPGSPSYARRAWAATPIPAALADVVAPGHTGALVLASAAAVTLGTWALPVYEVYKVGEDPRWEQGIAVMDRVLGWRCAVIPHYDNKEGGTHDTRFCYLGARRLARIEGQLQGGFIVGVDEHTAVLFDLDAARVRVAGRGGLTLRVAGAEQMVLAGSDLSLAEVESIIDQLGGSAGLVGSRQQSQDTAFPASQGRSSGVASALRDAGDRTSARSGSGEVEESTPLSAAPVDSANLSDPREAETPATTDLARTILDAIPNSEAQARAALVDLLGSAERAEESAGATSPAALSRWWWTSGPRPGQRAIGPPAIGSGARWRIWVSRFGILVPGRRGVGRDAQPGCPATGAFSERVRESSGSRARSVVGRRAWGWSGRGVRESAG